MAVLVAHGDRPREGVEAGQDRKVVDVGSTLLVVVNALRLLAFADMPDASNGSSQEAVTS